MPSLVLAPDMEQKINEFIASKPDYQQHLNLVNFGEIHFVDPGSNLETISCKICSKQLELTWWQERMSEAYQSKFTNLQVTTPCCKVISSLNDLDYDFEAGFAGFVIEVIDLAEVDKIIAELEGLMGCGVRKVLARY